MDISVSRLNNRMALKVPTELPLGLVFVTGKVEQLELPTGDNARYASFILSDEGYLLHGRVLRQVVEETLLKVGDRVRVSGQMVFDRQKVTYVLLARDLEVLAASQPSTRGSLQPILADMQKRAAATSLVQSELPAWVRKLAPPEIQAEIGLVNQEQAEEAGSFDLAPKPAPAEEGSSELLPDAMLSFLSNAIDSAEDIELTADMIAEYMVESGDPVRQTPASLPLTPPAADVPSVPDLPQPTLEGEDVEPPPSPAPEAASTASAVPPARPIPPPASSAPGPNIAIFLVLITLVLFIVFFLFLTLNVLNG